MPQVKDEYGCPMRLAMDLIGGKWKLTILWHLNEGTKRFSEIKRLMPDISHKMLAQQLREMEENRLLARKVYPDVPPRVEYSIAESGLLLRPVLSMLCQWGARYANDSGIMIRCTGDRDTAPHLFSHEV